MPLELSTRVCPGTTRPRRSSERTAPSAAYTFIVSNRARTTSSVSRIRSGVFTASVMWSWTAVAGCCADGRPPRPSLATSAHDEPAPAAEDGVALYDVGAVGQVDRLRPPEPARRHLLAHHVHRAARPARGARGRHASPDSGARREARQRDDATRAAADSARSGGNIVAAKADQSASSSYQCMPRGLLPAPGPVGVLRRSLPAAVPRTGRRLHHREGHPHPASHQQSAAPAGKFPGECRPGPGSSGPRTRTRRSQTIARWHRWSRAKPHRRFPGRCAGDVTGAVRPVSSLGNGPFLDSGATAALSRVPPGTPAPEGPRT